MPNLNIDIAYYDDEQRELFQDFPNADTLNKIVQNGITITEDEFLAYMMFTWQMDVNGFRTYNDLRALVQNNLGAVNQLLSFNNDSVQARVIGNDLMQTGYSERIGVSLGLCLMNKIHNLTAADWKKIPTVPGRKGHPTFDFDLPKASTGEYYIQCENKGSAVKDKSSQNTSIDSHYKSIKEKKKYIRAEEAKLEIPIHQNLYYGTIGVLDNKPNSKAKVWLVDPPAFDLEMDPKKYKLLARLNFYLDEFRNIGVKKKLMSALEARIKEITLASDFMQMNNKKLDQNFPATGKTYLYMDGKSYASIDTSEAFGQVYLLNAEYNNDLFLVAFPKNLMRIIVKQDFQAILDYKYDPEFVKERVQVFMRFTNSNFTNFKGSKLLKFAFSEKNGFWEATYFGKLRYTSDGRLFGLLNYENL